jgi:hypothetical protein
VEEIHRCTWDSTSISTFIPKVSITLLVFVYIFLGLKNSGAYIFRPKDTVPVKTGGQVCEGIKTSLKYHIHRIVC